MTNEEIELKANELSVREGCKVHPLVFKDDETQEDIIGFYREPSRMVKTRVLDKAITAPVTAAGELLELVILKQDSDPRILSEKPENDKYYLGASMAVLGVIKYSNDVFKKK